MNTATPKQRAFIERLGGNATDTMTTKEASALIETLLRAERQFGHAKGSDPVTEPGMYRDGAGAIYKVQRSKTDTTRLYAKVLKAIHGDRLLENGTDIVRWDFEYSPGAVLRLLPSQRLTLEEATAFGVKYGVCAVCGRTLKDATSVQQGIGPICIKNL